MTPLPSEGSELPATEHRHPDPEVGPWRLVLTWRVVNGTPECAGMSIRPLNPEGPLILSESTLRRLNLARLIAGMRARLITQMEPPLAPPPRMRPKTWQRLQEVARVYREALSSGGQPTQAVQRHFKISFGYAANLVFKAREARLLPPTSAGVALGDVDQGPNVQ